MVRQQIEIIGAFQWFIKQPSLRIIRLYFLLPKQVIQSFFSVSHTTKYGSVCHALVTQTDAEVKNPVWSPDTSKIFFLQWLKCSFSCFTYCQDFSAFLILWPSQFVQLHFLKFSLCYVSWAVILDVYLWFDQFCFALNIMTFIVDCHAVYQVSDISTDCHGLQASIVTRSRAVRIMF